MPPPPLHLRLRVSLLPSHPLPLPVSRRSASRFPFTTSGLLTVRPVSLRCERRFRAPLRATQGGAAWPEGFEEELGRLLELLPEELRRRVEGHPELPALVEVVMDLGRPPLARFPSGDFLLSHRPISFDDLLHATSQVGDFGADNRAGISRTLHRISAIRNRKGVIVGLTCRVGRAVPGSANLLQDLVKDGGSLLLIGPPGVGKTTVIREIARMLADDYKKRVMIVDTSNEIGGDGDIPHLGIGNARRLQVPNQEMQHKKKLEIFLSQTPEIMSWEEKCSGKYFFLDATDSILNSRSQQITLHQLSLQFCLRYHDCLSIGKIVAHTMATQKLDTAKFTILTEKKYVQCADADLLYFAKQFKMFFGACPDAFAGLTHLRLQNVRFGELDIPNILSTCKRLESLRFRNCDTRIQTVLQVEHPQLVELEISNGNFETVELNCLSKLERLTYQGWVSYGDPLSFGYVPKLSRLSLINTGRISDKVLKLSQLLANAPFISDLLLSFGSKKIWVQPECPKLLAPVLEKLQLVNLVDLPEGCDIAWTSFILEAAPFLKELCITVWDHWCKESGLCEKTDVEWESSASADFKHENLAVLTIFGFQPDNNLVTYIRRTMEAALNLEEVALYDRKVCRRCEPIDPTIKKKICPSRYPRTSEERDLLRKQITEGMRMASPAVIHFRS